MTRTGRLPYLSQHASAALVLTAAFLLCVVECPAAIAGLRGRPSAHERIQEERGELRRQFAEALEQIAKTCEQRQRFDEAAQIRSLARPAETGLMRLNTLPQKVQPEIPATLPVEEREWRENLRRRQNEFAQNLFKLSQRALRTRNYSLAYKLVQEVAQYDPDHPMARRILGYQRHGDEWLTPFAARMKRNNMVWHDRFGWLPESHVARYENGERFFGRWRSAAQDAEIHRDFRNAWVIRTEHYLVKTNHSLERGVEIATLLEDYHDFFIQTFAMFFNSPDQLRKLFRSSGRIRGSQLDPYEVHYFDTRDLYIRRLKGKIPNIEITNGLYYTSDRVAYFFFDPERQNNDSLYHEATHQLFYESRRLRESVAIKGNFWIVEGIACYMESLKEDNGQLLLGDPRHQRLDNARYRYFQDRYFVPLRNFAAMGMQDFQSSRKLSMNYSQAAGLAHFFMHYDGGRYRDALIEHLSQIYSVDRRTRNAPQSLAELTGVSFAELDRQYGRHLEEMERALAARTLQSPESSTP